MTIMGSLTKLQYLISEQVCDIYVVKILDIGITGEIYQIISIIMVM